MLLFNLFDDAVQFDNTVSMILFISTIQFGDSILFISTIHSNSAQRDGMRGSSATESN